MKPVFQKIAVFQGFKSVLLQLVLSVITAGFTMPVLHAQGPALDWFKDYGSNKYDTPYNVLTTSDGGYLVVGYVSENTGDVSSNGGSGYNSSNKGWIIKLNSSGAIVWKKAYVDEVSQAVEVSDGYVLVGTKFSKLWYAKINKSSGSITWEQTYTTQSLSKGHTIVTTPDGGYLIGGYFSGNTSGALLVKVNNSTPGAITNTWLTHPNGGIWGRIIVQIEKTPDGGYILLGDKTIDVCAIANSQDFGMPMKSDSIAEPENSDMNCLNCYDVWMCKVSSTYSFPWSKLYGGSTTDTGRDLVVTPDGNIFLLGNTWCTESNTTGPNNVGEGDWLLKANSSGTTQDVALVSVDYPDLEVSLFGIGLSCDNELLLCGKQRNFGNIWAIIRKYDTSNIPSVLWETDSGVTTTEDRYFTDVVKTSDNGFVAIGVLDKNDGIKLDDWYICKFLPDPDCGGGGGGNFCNKAIPVSCGQFLANETFAGSTNDINNYSCPGGTTTQQGVENVYKIVLTQNSDLQIGLEILNSGVDLDLYLLSDNCNSITCLASSTLNNPGTGNNKEAIVNNLNPGTYYIVVERWSGNSSYNIDFACGELNCTFPTQLTCGVPYNGTTVNATNNVSIYRQNPQPGWVDVNNAGKERIHRFNLNQQSTVTITLSNVSSNVNLELFLLGSCDKDNGIARSINPAGQNEVITITLPAGTYYVVVDGFRNFEGSYTLTVDCGGCPQPPVNNFNCNLISCYYSGTGTNLQYTFNATQSIAPGYNWKITGNNLNVTGGSGTSYTYNFANPGTYQICYPYLLPNNCVEYCCITLCVANPFDCDGSIRPIYNSTASAWQFSLTASNATDIRWRNDTNGQSAGTGSQSNLIYVPNPCTGTAWTISASYFDGTCYRVCCYRYYPCNPFDCGLITYNYLPLQNGFQFKLNTIGGFDQSTIIWTVDSPVSQSLGNGSELSSVLPTPSPCNTYTISVRFRDGSGTWKICCLRVYLCNPFDCFDFGYYYVPASNGFQFSLNQSVTGATNISWTVDDAPGGPQNIGSSATSNIYPVPGTCVERTITVRYFWNNRWYICCRKIWLCNPFDCFDFGYYYVPASNGFQFSLNQSVTGATNISWTVDDAPGGPQNIGSAATSNIYPVPGSCVERIITVRYFWQNRWYVCCRRVWLCNPFDCFDFGYNYIPASNGFQFSLNQSVTGATNINWTVDDAPGGPQNIGSSATSNIYPVPGSCVERTITVRYFWQNRWWICCRRIYLCNPFDCFDFGYYYVQASNGYQLSLNQSVTGATNISWTDDDAPGGPQNIGSSASIYYPLPGSCVVRTITARYYWQNRWWICCRKIYLCNPDLCSSEITSAWSSNGTLNLSINSTNQQAQWSLSTGTVLGTGNSISIPNPGNNSVVCVFYRDASGIWRQCCKNIGQAPSGTQCTAKVSATETLEFMCLNLGAANTTADPLTPSWEIFGSYWQWGRLTQAAAGPSGPGSSQTNSGSITGWNTTNAPNGAWSNASKTANDPCPGGFRVPTQAQWDGVIANNTKLNIGTWINSTTNYGSGVRFGNTLFLPAAGLRGNSNGLLQNRGSNGYYWSSTENGTTNGAGLSFTSSNTLTLNLTRTNGFSVRCIAQSTTGSIGSINCTSPTITGTLTANQAASGVSATVTYTGGNGGSHNGQSVTSTGVTGLTATLAAGTFANGNGSLVYAITGTPGSAGSASFALNIGGKTCTLVVPVQAPSGNGLTFDIDDNICGAPGSTMQVPIRVRGFSNVLSFEMSVSVSNPAVSQIVSIQSNSLPGTPLFGVINPSSAYLSWFDANPSTLADNTVIGNLAITLAGTPPSTSDVLLGSNPVSAKASQLIAGSITEFVPVLQNGSVCLSANFGISGRITREDNAGIGNVTVQITGPAINQSTVTDSQGNYTFSNLTSGGNYTITPSKNINHKNGLSGLDLVTIQRHILNLAPLNSPFKLIAADANNSKNISGLDLALFQRLILGLDQVLSFNTSWQFVDKSHVFSNPGAPWTPAYPQTRTISGLSGNITNADFTGVKIGDVNLNNDPGGISGQGNNDRYPQSVTLQIPDRIKVADGFVHVPVIIAEDFKLQGIQLSLEFDHEIFELVNITNAEGLEELGEANLNLTRKNEGFAALVWVTPDGTDRKLKSGQKIFDIQLKVKDINSEWIQLGNRIQLSDEITSSVVVSNDLVEYALKWEASGTATGEGDSFHFAPNPFNNSTTLNMNLTDATSVRLKLLDAEGRTLFDESKWVEKGKHSWSLSSLNFSASRVIFYQIQTDTGVTSGRLVKAN